MKNSIKVLCYILAFIGVMLIMYIFLFFRLGNSYLDLKKDTYSLNDIVNEVRNQSYDIDDYNIYFDNLRLLTDSEKATFNSYRFKYVPRYRAVGKAMFEDKIFLLRAVDDDSELFYFFQTSRGTFVELIHWGESIYDVYYAYFEVDGLDISDILNKEVDNSKIKIEMCQNSHYEMSNVSILAIWIILEIIAEITVYKIIKRKSAKNNRTKRAK